MGDLSISFVPQLPTMFLWVLLALAILGVGAALKWRLSGWFLRALAFAVLLLALAGPQLRQEEREGLPNVAFVVVDNSASTTLEDRSAQIAAAAEEIAAKIAAISTPSDPFELVTVDVSSDVGDADRGTRLLTALDEASARVAPWVITLAIIGS